MEGPTHRTNPLAGREALTRRIADLQAQGICPTCRDLHHGEVFTGQPMLTDTETVRVVLDAYPQMPGHTIVIWKPHHEDFTTLEPGDTARFFGACTEVANALKVALDAEKVYLVTMCDGYPNHLHVQLMPRYAGEDIGPHRLVRQRTALVDGESIADRIRAALET